MDRIEKFVIDNKRGKMTRDCIDYENNSHGKNFSFSLADFVRIKGN